MRIMATMLAMALVAAAQEEGSVPAPTGPGTAALDTAAARQGKEAWEASQEPVYRTREPLRASGTPKEQVTGAGSQVSPDKAQKASGEW